MENDTSFDTDIEWCVCQLVLGLIRSNPNSEQIKESKRVINKLQGNKLAFVSKRHLMSVVFGDYHKRMRETPLVQLKEELKKHNLPGLSAQYHINLES